MERYTEVLRNDPQQRRRALLRRRGRLPGGPVPAGHRARPPLAVDRPAAGARAQPDRPGAAPAGQTKEALESFRRRDRAATSNFADAYGNRANMLSELGRPAEALSSFDRALALNPNSATDWLNRGATLHGLGRADEAIASYDRAIALDAEFLRGASSTAPTCCTTLGRFEEALAGYDRAIALAPNVARASCRRAPGAQELAGWTRRWPAADRAHRAQAGRPQRSKAAPPCSQRSAAPRKARASRRDGGGRSTAHWRHGTPKRPNRPPARLQR